MDFLLDTSAYSEFNRGNHLLKKWFRGENNIIVPVIVIGELRAGFASGTKPRENEALLQRFLDSPNVTTITLTDTTTKLFAQVYGKLRQKGRPIGVNDMWIAALALEHNLTLLTLDQDFMHVPDLMLGKLKDFQK